MSEAIDWKHLQYQFLSDEVYRKEVSKLAYSPEKDPSWKPGQSSSKHFPTAYADALIKKRLKEQKVQEGFCENLVFNDDNHKDQQPKSENTFVSGKKISPINKNVHSNFVRHLSQMSGDSQNRDGIHSVPINVIKSAAERFSQSKSKIMKKQTPLYHADQLAAVKTDALDFMRLIMDECTHLGNFSMPVDTELITIISAQGDGYIPRDCISLKEIWPGCEVRDLDAGHVQAFLFSQAEFKKAIVEGFDKITKKYYKPNLMYMM